MVAGGEDRNAVMSLTEDWIPAEGESVSMSQDAILLYSSALEFLFYIDQSRWIKSWMCEVNESSGSGSLGNDTKGYQGDWQKHWPWHHLWMLWTSSVPGLFWNCQLLSLIRVYCSITKHEADYIPGLNFGFSFVQLVSFFFKWCRVFWVSFVLFFWAKVMVSWEFWFGVQ